MKTLNLVDPDNSNVRYIIQNMPDGQHNVVIKEEDYYSLDLLEGQYIQIKSRLNNWIDLEIIICAVASLRELGVEEIHLYVPYILGARSDRKFEEGGNNYLRDVICPIINSMGFKTVTCIDPHSDCLEMGIRGFRKQSNLALIKFALNRLYPKIIPKQDTKPTDFILVSPDAGASKKIYKLAEQIGYKGDIITCSKERDAEGKLTKTVFPFETHKYNGEDFIIIDDICDGGATFINIARRIKDCFAIRGANQNIKPGKIYLIVTHSVFSKGFNELSKYFDGIYCTNSYSETRPANILDSTETITALKKVKQLNVF